MAQIDGSSNTFIYPVRSPLGSPQIRYFEESTCASSKTIRRGDIVCLDTVVTTAARIVLAPSSQGAAGNLLQNGITSLIGVAMADSTSDGSTNGLQASTARAGQGRLIPVAVADGLTEFAIHVSSVGATPQAICSSMMDRPGYPIEMLRTIDRGGHGVWFLSSTNLSTAADVSAVITDVPSESIGDTGGIVYFKFLSTMVHRSVRFGGPVT